ncbi:hypothetical protein K7X08_021962 [Anisodus acutangulus]|uniref:Uncharacterized protein n=1 Tax=Anisodus acutangulus TaxID=402998 RepID=A0A9Q1QV57_9SOLA|nr:hypothetical protein K7X08_021962 [Anisodus acutangulus]
MNISTSASSRSQRVNEAKTKEVFQFIFVIVVCIWLLYQIQNSHNGERIRSKLVDEHGAHSLGQKGSSQWLTVQGDSQHENTDIMKSEHVVSRVEEELQANETELENFGNEVHTFDDENGIPEDVRDMKYMTNELIDELKTNPHPEVTTSLDGERFRGRSRI